MIAEIQLDALEADEVPATGIRTPLWRCRASDAEPITFASRQSELLLILSDESSFCAHCHQNAGHIVEVVITLRPQVNLFLSVDAPDDLNG